MKIPVFLITGIVLGVGVVGLLRYGQQPRAFGIVPSVTHPSPALLASHSSVGGSPSVSEIYVSPFTPLISTVPPSGNTNSTIPSDAIGLITAMRSALQSNGLPTSDAQSYGMGLYSLFRQYGELSPVESSAYAMQTVLMLQNPHYHILGSQLFQEAYSQTHQGPLKVVPLLNAAASMPSEAEYVAELEIAIHGYQDQGEIFDATHLITPLMPSALLTAMINNLEHANPATVSELFGLPPISFSPIANNTTVPSNSAS